MYLHFYLCSKNKNIIYTAVHFFTTPHHVPAGTTVHTVLTDLYYSPPRLSGTTFMGTLSNGALSNRFLNTDVRGDSASSFFGGEND